MSAIIPDSRTRRLASRIHALGPQPLAYLFAELSARANPRDCIERYAALDPAIVRALEAEQMPPRLRVISGGGK